MDEVYTCICSHQEFSIHDDSTISCSDCGRIYSLVLINNEMESPEGFNERIKREGGK